MGGYWVDSPDNPFNQMSYTRGGGGYDNSSTHESNTARAHAMQGAGAAALPHFATPAVAQKVLPAGSLAVVGGSTVVKTAGAGGGSVGAGAVSSGGGGAGPASGAVATAPAVRTKGAGSALKVSGSDGFSGPLKVKTKPEATKLLMGGDWWASNPWWSDTEEWEARYGEPGDWFGGVIVFGADTVFNVARALDTIQPTNNHPDREPQPMHDNGWVSHDEGVTWTFQVDDGTQPFMWDTGGRNPDLNPWR